MDIRTILTETENVDTSSNQSTLDDMISTIFHTRDQTHLWHLQTDSYAVHKALNEYYDKILELGDSIIETTMGALDIKPSKVDVPTIEGIETRDMDAHLNDVQATFGQFRQYFEQQNCTDVANLCDEIAQLANQTRYMLTLD